MNATMSWISESVSSGYPSGRWDKSVQIWDMADRKSAFVLKGYSAEVLAIAWHPEGIRVVGAGLDKTLRIWDSTTGEYLRSLGKNTALYALVIALDGRFIVTGGENRVTKLTLSAE